MEIDGSHWHKNKVSKDLNIYNGEYLNFRGENNSGLSLTLDQPNIALQNFDLYNNKKIHGVNRCWFNFHHEDFLLDVWFELGK